MRPSSSARIACIASPGIGFYRFYQGMRRSIRGRAVEFASAQFSVQACARLDNELPPRLAAAHSAIIAGRTVVVVINGTFQRKRLSKNWMSFVVTARLSEPRTRQTGM